MYPQLPPSRLLNGGHVFAYIWSIDEFNFTVVATDGAACQPYVTDALQIHVGERFDVEVRYTWARGSM